MKYDVIVVGGGFAGTAAAVSAAREGAKVLLLEKSGFLGGAAGNCYVNPFMGYTTKIDGKTTRPFFGIVFTWCPTFRETAHAGTRRHNAR